MSTYGGGEGRCVYSYHIVGGCEQYDRDEGVRTAPSYLHPPPPHNDNLMS
jgi:hypothetical protein